MFLRYYQQKLTDQVPLPEAHRQGYCKIQLLQFQPSPKESKEVCKGERIQQITLRYQKLSLLIISQEGKKFEISLVIFRKRLVIHFYMFMGSISSYYKQSRTSDRLAFSPCPRRMVQLDSVTVTIESLAVLGKKELLLGAMMLVQSITGKRAEVCCFKC